MDYKKIKSDFILSVYLTKVCKNMDGTCPIVGEGTECPLYPGDQVPQCQEVTAIQWRKHAAYVLLDVIHNGMPPHPILEEGENM